MSKSKKKKRNRSEQKDHADADEAIGDNTTESHAEADEAIGDNTTENGAENNTATDNDDTTASGAEKSGTTGEAAPLATQGSGNAEAQKPVRTTTGERVADRRTWWPLAAAVTLVLAALVAGFVVTRDAGEESVDLDIGTCFLLSDDGDRAPTGTVDCSTLHQAEAFGSTSSEGSAGEAEDACVEQLVPLVGAYALPADFELLVYDEATPALCVIASPSGELAGSILAAE